jgi:hypothetical protein
VVVGVLLAGLGGWGGFSPGTAQAQTSSVVTVMAVGDLAAGDFRPRGTDDEQVAALIARQNPTAVLGLGDLNQGYGCYEYYASQGGFEGSYGPIKSLFMTAPGNHDHTRPAQGSSWDTEPDEDGLRCSGRPYGAGYYKYFREQHGGMAAYVRRVGAWDIISIDSGCNWRPSHTPTMGPTPPCGRSDMITNFLRQALHQSEVKCQAVMMHYPRFATAAPFTSHKVLLEWVSKVAVSWKADLFLAGHNHVYERLKPVDPYTEKVSYRRGIRQFVVGTGGYSQIPFRGKVHPASAARVFGVYGALRLRLSATGWSSHFLGIDGSTRDPAAAGCV